MDTHLMKELYILVDFLETLRESFGFEEFDELNELPYDIEFPFPRDCDIFYQTDYVINIAKEFNSFKIHNKNKVTTDTITQRVVIFDQQIAHSLIDKHKLKYDSEQFSIDVISNPLLIGIACVCKDEYSKYSPPCSSYYAIEIKYRSKENRLSEKEEDNLIKRYFFELGILYELTFNLGEFSDVIFDDVDEVDNAPSIRDIEVYNYGMDLFNKAIQPLEEDISFLYFYKILEYFSPISAKIYSLESLRKKLDSIHLRKIDANFLQSIFDLSFEYQEQIKDKEQVKSLINVAFDLVDIANSLPATIQKRLKKEISNQLSYKSSIEQVDKVINLVGNYLYGTRNSIVHAKSNYIPTGFECPEEELKSLNEFMKKACYSTIKWYNRLPEHYKLLDR